MELKSSNRAQYFAPPYSIPRTRSPLVCGRWAIAISGVVFNGWSNDFKTPPLEVEAGIDKIFRRWYGPVKFYWISLNCPSACVAQLVRLAAVKMSCHFAQNHRHHPKTRASSGRQTTNEGGKSDPMCWFNLNAPRKSSSRAFCSLSLDVSSPHVCLHYATMLCFVGVRHGLAIASHSRLKSARRRKSDVNNTHTHDWYTLISNIFSCFSPFSFCGRKLSVKLQAIQILERLCW